MVMSLLHAHLLTLIRSRESAHSFRAAGARYPTLPRRGAEAARPRTSVKAARTGPTGDRRTVAPSTAFARSLRPANVRQPPGRPRAGARRRARAYAAVSGCRASAAYVARRPQSDRRGAQTLAVAEIAPSPPSLPPCRTRGLPYGHHTVRTHRGAARTEAQQGADKEPRPSGSRAYAEGAPTWRAGVSCYRCSYATYASNVSMPKSRGRSKSRSRRRVFISGPSSTLLPHAHRVC